MYFYYKIYEPVKKSMNLNDWKKLQNGSDIRGVAMAGIAGEDVNLTSGIANRLGEAFVSWLLSKGKGPGNVAVGMDSRITGPDLKQAFSEGVKKSGFDVMDCGIASTPAMFMTTIDPELNAAGAVMLTASHLPFNRNGMKFFTASGGFDKKDISDLLRIAFEGPPAEMEGQGQTVPVDFITRYAGHLVDKIRKGVNDPDHFDTPLAGMKIIVDAGNGAGGFFAEKVLLSLGADITGSQFLDPDGRFPNHVPNPEDGGAMDSICAAVLREKADLGIIFDTDVDRAALVDATGSAINRNDLIALIASVVLEEHPGSVIVTDSITSAGLKTFIEEALGGIHHRFRRGYKNVINESIRLNLDGKQSWLAIETSGHAALKENHFLDDGAYLVAKLLIQAARMRRQGKSLGSLIEGLRRPVEEMEFRLKILDENFGEYGTRVLEELKEKIGTMDMWSVEQPNYEGLRVTCSGEDEKGWFLLRMSLHDPVLPLNVESDTEGGVSAIISKLKGLLDEYTGLDTSTL